jgi:MFS family permease
LTEARNFAENGFFANGFFVPEFDYPDYGHNPSGVHSDSFPIISIIVGFLFMIFGSSLALARLVGISFSIGTIFIMYLLSTKLFKNKWMALIVAFLTALSPLFVFFSHNVQLMNIGVFFMVTSLYFFASWIKEDRAKLLYLASLFFTLAALTKYSFGIAIVPMLFMVPKSRYKKLKKYTKQLIYSVLIFLPFVFWVIYSEFFIAKQAGASAITRSLFDLTLVFSSSWIIPMRAYITDNYTNLGFILAIAGVVLFLLFRKKNIGNRFFMGSLVGIGIFSFIMADKLQGHSYHQFPVAPFVIFFMAYAIMVISTNLPKYVLKKENARQGLTLFIIIILLFLLIGPSTAAKNRQFDTQFVGLDIAGEYIRENSELDERIIHSGHQDYGLIWHAERKGIGDGVPDEEKIRYSEEDLNVRWIFIYQWELGVIEKPQWEYISNEYSLKQLAFEVGADGTTSLVYLLLQKGGSFDIDSINELVADKQVQTKNYELTGGTIGLNYVNI